MTPQQKAFLDMIAISELGQELIDLSDNGYNVLVGSTPTHPLLFASYATHPRILNQQLHSTAAGRYQLLARYYEAYKIQLNLSDFSPAAQDAIALRQIEERDALADIEAGDLDTAIAKCSNIWASLPGNSYGQRANTLSYLKDAFVNAGGALA